MSTSVFREAVDTSQQADTPKTSEKPIADIGSPVQTHIDSLLATYSDDMGKPYTAQYLGLDGVWDKDATLTNEINTIEGFLKQQISKGKLDNSVKAGQKYLKELEKKAGTHEYETATKRISKLLAYIDFRKVVDA